MPRQFFNLKTVLSVLVLAGVFVLKPLVSKAQTIPAVSDSIVDALESSQWIELESGLDVIRGITASGVTMTGYRISPDEFEFSIATQKQSTGSRAKDVGEMEGAVLATNAGFFAQNSNGDLYSIGYLRLDSDVLSKGWGSEGGVISWDDGNLVLTPTHRGIPINESDALQSRPMLIEPGGNWAMKSNLGEVKNRTILCTLPNKDVIFALVTRVGMSLYEAGWVMRDKQVGGFFGCDAAIALDGGRSTQVWYSRDQRYSYSGLASVHNFFLVRPKDQ